MASALTEATCTEDTWWQDLGVPRALETRPEPSGAPGRWGATECLATSSPEEKGPGFYLVPISVV